MGAPRNAIYPRLERMDRGEIRALQEQRLVRALDRVWHTAPFYRDHWGRSGVTRDAVRTLDDLRRLPLVGKEELLADQEEAPPYGRRLAVRDDQVFEISLSSGTSGRSQEVHAHTARDAHLRGALHAISCRWAGAEPADSIAFHIGISNSASHGSLHRGLRVAGRLPYLVGHMGFEQRLAMLEDYGVDWMYAMPSALNGLAQLCEARGTTPRAVFTRLKGIFTSGEAWPVEFAERTAEEWGVPLFEGYGASQTYACFIMSNCEHGALHEGRRGSLHMYEWAAVLEVIDPETLEPTPPGEPGELVITHLEKEASPLVRFRTRDKVVWYPHTRCSCGRQLDIVESGTISRWDDMLKIKGQNVFPQQVDEIMFSQPEIAEYQGRVYIGGTGRDEAEIRYGLAAHVEVSDAQQEHVEAQLQKALKAVTNVTFALRRVPRTELPEYTTPDAKPRRWTDDRQEALKTGHRG